MKKLKLIFAVMLTAMCFASANAVVKITPPTKPESVVTELKAGESYYLFNIGKGQFVNRNTSDNYSTGWSDTPFAFRLDESSDGYFALWQGSAYLGSWNNVHWAYSTSNTDSYVRLDVQKNEGDSYKIREVYPNALWGYYNSGSYSSYVFSGYSTSTTGENVGWLFLKAALDVDKNEIVRYYYVKKLYEAIVAVDAKGYHIGRYEDIYNDESKTNSQLNEVANELNNGLQLSEGHSYLFPSWNDCPILITSLGSWERYSNNNYLRKHTYNSDSGTTNTLKTSVYVDQPSTMYFTLDCDQRWQNEATMSFQVFVDGELAYDYKGETCRYYYDSYFGNVLHGTSGNNHQPYGQYYYYNSGSHDYNRHAIDLEPGHHFIDIVTTQKYNGTNGFYTYFRQIGVEKTPTIEVNLAKEGSLGDEVLRAMDNNPLITESNIRNVRRLKISGKMGDADWTELYNMTQITALDLTDAQVTEIKTGQLSQYYHESLQYLHDLKLPKTLKTIGQEAFYATYIDSVDIPESVTFIGDFAFSNTRLREANIPNVTSIGHSAFRGCTMLNKVVMKNVEWMGINAFAECYNLKDIVFEGNLTTIPERTFYYCEELELKSLQESVTSIEQFAFYWNKKATFCLPAALKSIDKSAFEGAYSIQGDIPASLTSIGENALSYAWYMSNEDIVTLPANTSFGNSTFLGGGMKNVVVPQEYYSLNATKMFANCDSLKSLKFMSPTLVSVPADFVDGLTKRNIKVYVPDYLRTTYMRDSYWMDFTIESFPTTEMDSIVVRQNLALSQHDRFEGTPGLAIEKGVQFELEGAAGMDLKNITLSSDLEANNYSQIVSGTDQVSVNGLASERLYTKANKWYFISLPFDCKLSQTVNENGGKYAIRYYDGASRAAETYPALIDDGETEVYLYNVSARAYLVGANNYNTRASISTTNKYAFKIINNGDGTWTLKNYVQTQNAWKSMFADNGEGIWVDNNDGANANNWVITSIGNGKYEITNKGIAEGKLGAMLGSDDTRLYINNAVNATTWAFVTGDVHNSNWKNYNVSTDIIPAGTGFIFMTSQDSWTRFYSVDNGTKNRIFEDSENENNEFHYELQKHPSEDAANRGWNLVGNPYPNYYNNHKISFAAPITLWDGTTYKAYSLRDDDIAIKPNQAIFVQCPEDVAEISFPAAGRQTTAVITDQANAHVRGEMNNVRQIVDLSLTNGTYTDDTRVVINPEASLCYEVGCDAGKFMSMDAAVQQLYTLDATNNRYAINERPLAEGRVVLGISIPAEGTYTFSLKRNQAETVLLIDNETGFIHDLTADDYTFTAKAGANDGRFVLSIVAAEVTSVENVENNAASHADMYTVDGIRVNSAAKSGVYIKRNGKNVTKVVVK